MSGKSLEIVKLQAKIAEALHRASGAPNCFHVDIDTAACMTRFTYEEPSAPSINNVTGSDNERTMAWVKMALEPKKPEHPERAVFKVLGNILDDLRRHESHFPIESVELSKAGLSVKAHSAESLITGLNTLLEKLGSYEMKAMSPKGDCAERCA